MAKWRESDSKNSSPASGAPHRSRQGKALLYVLCAISVLLGGLWEALATCLLADSAHRFDVYGVSLSPLDSTLAYVAAQSPGYHVIRINDLRTSQLFRVKGVPMSLVIDARGQIAFVHPSVFQSVVQRDSVFTAAEFVALASADTTRRVSDSVPPEYQCEAQARGAP